MNSIKVSLLLIFVLTLFQWSCVNNTEMDKINHENEKSKSELTILTEKINKDSTNANLFNQRALLYVYENKVNEALGDINKALQIDNKNSEYFVTLSDIYLKMGEAGKCNNALNKAISLDEKNNSAILKAAELNLLIKNYDRTFELVDKALKLDNINPIAYYIKGYTYLELKDTAKAIRNFQFAIDQKQDYYKAYLQLGVLYLARNDIRAIGYYENALKVNSQSIEALYGIAMYYQNNNQYQKALDKYTEILKIDPENTLAYYNTGYVYLVYLNEFEKAIMYFSNAIEISPSYSDAYYNRGYCYELLNDFVNARKDFQKTLELVTNHKKAIEGLNRIDKKN